MTENNLLVQAGTLYPENEYIVAAFKALPNFTFKVTLPHLCFVENAAYLFCGEK